MAHDPVIAKIVEMDHISPFHRLAAIIARQQIIECVDHDLSGPRGADKVFATCSKCPARFKVRITEEPE